MNSYQFWLGFACCAIGTIIGDVVWSAYHPVITCFH